MGEVPHLDSNSYLFSKKRKDQISLKQHRLQSAYLQPLLVQWDLHTTNFYHNEVFPPVTVKNIENNQDKRNPVNPFVILRYRCIQRIQEASIIQKYACISQIYLENEEENQSTNQLPGMSEKGSRIQMWHSAIKGRWSWKDAWHPCTCIATLGVLCRCTYFLITSGDLQVHIKKYGPRRKFTCTCLKACRKSILINKLYTEKVTILSKTIKYTVLTIS